MPEPGNYQLYVLIKNRKLQASIRQTAQGLWDSRNIPDDEQQQITARYHQAFRPDEDQPLKCGYWILVMILPFAAGTLIIQPIISSYLLASGTGKNGTVTGGL
jgi:hypothetical protein